MTQWRGDDVSTFTTIQRSRYDSIINKTLLSAGTNRKIGGSAPSVYLPRIATEAGMDVERQNDVLRSHLIDPELLRADDFDGFFKAREKALVEVIEEAMGKPAVSDASEATIEDEELAEAVA